jgi:hypothetical protein
MLQADPALKKVGIKALALRRWFVARRALGLGPLRLGSTTWMSGGMKEPEVNRIQNSR